MVWHRRSRLDYDEANANTSRDRTPRMKLRERIDHNTADFSPSDTQIAAYLLEHLEEAMLLTGAELAAHLEISASSVTRFAQRLGFEGYPDLRRELRRERRERQAPSVPDIREGVFAAYWQREQQNLEELSRTSDGLLDRSCEALSTARRVWILGSRSNRGHAILTHELLSGVRPDVHLLETNAVFSPEALLEATPEDAALVFTTGRYARSSTRLATALHDAGAALLLVTDHGASPLLPLATFVLRVPTQAIDQYGASGLMSSLAHLLVIGTAQRSDPARRQRLEAMLEDFDVFE
jgi:DNA-binding MurR/RpiR family transcriptional regulator